jgi:hypothetical protein
MTEVVNFNKERAQKEQDCRLWSPLEALEDLVAEIKAGQLNPEQLGVHYLEPDGDGKRHGYAAAGVTFPDHIALLHIALHSVVSKWLR